jgi:hypothetical protein
MKAEREGLDPAKRSILAKTSADSVIDVFSFILPTYYARRIHASKVAPARVCGFALGPDPEAGGDFSRAQASALSGGEGDLE